MENSPGLKVLTSSLENILNTIHPNEHPPPHFHVICDKFNVSLSITDCFVLKGEIDSRNLKMVKYCTIDIGNTS